MAKGLSAIVIILAGAANIAHGAVEGYLLYTPKPAETTQIPATPEEGILVKSITIQRGDTLSVLAHKFYGRGALYPEFLPFNGIKNPNLIYAGERLAVPLPKGANSVVSRKFKEKRNASRQTNKHASRTAKKTSLTVSKPFAAQEAGRAELTGADEFGRAVKLYRHGKYKRALATFDGFLKHHPASILAADAILYRGDCYLHLSGR